jgi:predicted regulator of Ras-like GTPase activity (Roadblock/LC7/MglB family)
MARFAAAGGDGGYCLRRHVASSMLRPVDAAQALADLTEISSQIIHVAMVGDDGSVLASTLGDETREARFAEGVARLLAEADAARVARGLVGLTQLEAATLEGSVFIVLSPTGAGYIAAVTRPEPTVGLVFYDLKHCLKSVATTSPVPDSGAAAEDSTEELSNLSQRRKKADASA